MQVIEYGRMGVGDVAKGTGAISGSSITTGSEVTLFTLLDPKYLDKSQLALYIKQALGSATKVAYGVYFSPDGGITWYKISVEDLTTNKGDLVDIPPYVDTNSPGGGAGTVETFFPVPIPPATALKVTATATGGNAGAWVITPAFRNN